MSSISRRELVGGLAAASLVVSAGALRGADDATARKPVKTYKNEDFYKDGKFDAAAGKQAYYDMFDRFGYPIPPRLRTDDFWTLDFNLGKFLEAGMAGIFWVNNKEHNYFGHEIYLLPGQAIPEHKHVKTDVPCKLEGWHPRYGEIRIFGEEGAADPDVKGRMPSTHAPFTNCRSSRILKPGEVAGLAKPEEWHFMRAGPEGAIVTEYATYHDGAGLRFANPGAKV
jgi:hypothetical protein